MRHIAAAKRVHVESIVQAEFISVAPKPPAESAFRDQGAALGREQIDPIAEQGQAVLDPVLDRLGRPTADSQHAASLRG